jgi:hypothetical protein
MKIDKDRLIAQFARAKFYVGEEWENQICFESDWYDYQIEATFDSESPEWVKLQRTWYPEGEPFIVKEYMRTQFILEDSSLIEYFCRGLMDIE